MSSDVKDLLQSVYAEPGTVFNHLHEDFVCHSPGKHPLAGSFHGAAAFADHLAAFHEHSQGAFSMGAPEAILAGPEWAVVVTPISGVRNNKSLSAFGFGVWRLRGSMLAEHWECVSNQAEWDAFWS